MLMCHLRFSRTSWRGNLAALDFRGMLSRRTKGRLGSRLHRKQSFRLDLRSSKRRCRAPGVPFQSGMIRTDGQAARPSPLRFLHLHPHGHSWISKFSVIAGAFELPCQAIIGGELVVVVHDGPDQLLRAAGRTRRKSPGSFAILRLRSPWPRRPRLATIIQLSRKELLRELSPPVSPPCTSERRERLILHG